MQAFVRRLGTTSLVAALACLLSGCQSSTPGASRLNNIFTFSKRERPEDKVVTPAMRMESLRVLARQAPKMSPEEQALRASEVVQHYQQEPDPLIRMEMIRTLGALPTPQTTEVLAQALRDGDRDVRITVCNAWAQRGGPEAATVLSQVLSSDTDIDVRMAAARGLGKLGPQQEQVVPALALALEDRDPALQLRAMESLRTVTGRDYGHDASAWREYCQGGQPPQASFVSRLTRNIF